MRSRNSGESFSGRLYALDTVMAETPSASATVASVTRPGVRPPPPADRGSRARRASSYGHGGELAYEGVDRREWEPAVADHQRGVVVARGEAIAGEPADPDAALLEPPHDGRLVAAGRQPQEQVQAGGDAGHAAVRELGLERFDERVAALPVLAPGAAQVAVD